MNTKPASEFLWLVCVTMLLCAALVLIDSWLFGSFEYTRGINWIHLPSGIALLAPLLFTEAGAVGLLLFSLVAGHLLFPDDPVRGYVGAILVTAAAHGTYRLGRFVFGLDATLSNLTPARLIGLCVVYAMAGPLLHHLWFALQGQDHLARGFVVMFTGNLTGSLLVIYAAKLLLYIFPEVTGP